MRIAFPILALEKNYSLSTCIHIVGIILLWDMILWEHGTLLSAGVSAGESSIRSWRNGATQDQIIDARNKAFAGTFISYGIGWGIGTYFGLSKVYKLNQHMWINVGIELFGEVLGEIIGV